MDKTLLVGWDAACWDYVNPLLDQGRLPNLARLIANGSAGTLNSTMPPWTPTAWSSLITGKNPGKHGIFDILWKKPGTYDFFPTNASHRRGTSFWQYLNQQGLKTGLVNVPFTYPIEPLEGFIVCGFGTPPVENVAYPDEAATWIREQYQGFQPEINAEVLRTAPAEQIFQEEADQQKRFVEIAIDLAAAFEVQVLIINLMFPDHANHKMPTLEQVHQSYERTDTDLGALIEGFEPKNILLVSDHGSSRIKGDFWLGAWLQDHGYLVDVERPLAESGNDLNWLLSNHFRSTSTVPRRLEKVIRRVWREALLRLPRFLSEGLWQQLEAKFPGARRFITMSGKTDYRSSSAFPGSVYSGLIYLNVHGREAEGFLAGQDREALATELGERLLKIQDPETGKPIFSAIYRSSEIYSGEAVQYAPDLILDANDLGWNIRSRKFTSHPGNPVSGYFYRETQARDYGWHAQQGLFVFAGPAFDHHKKDQFGDLMDIPATLLHIHGVPIPDDYDGKVLQGVLSQELAAAEIRHQPGDSGQAIIETRFEADEEQVLLDHLRALGYLE